MKAYRTLWLLVCTPLAMLGLGLALVLSPGANAELLGAGAFLLVLLVLLSSPYAVRATRRWLRSIPTPSAAQLDALARAFAYASPEYVPFQPLPGVGGLTDEQLCREWQASYLALQHRSSTAQVLVTATKREDYLDEFERRNPDGLAAWLASGAWASSLPLSYLTRGRGDQATINWDELIRGQDW